MLLCGAVAGGACGLAPVHFDAGPPHESTGDGGSAADAGHPVDGQPRDAGTGDDAGVAGPTDAGGDRSSSDAAVGDDAGRSDAGVAIADAGCGGGSSCSQDAGPRTGCDAGSECRSGQCVAHNCVNCDSDAQCANGWLCGSGHCTAPCPATPCPFGFMCCEGRCVDNTTDVTHCGASCGLSCAPGETCGGGQCLPSTLQVLCARPVVHVVHDSHAADDAAGDAIGAALAGRCQNGVLLTSPGADAGLLDVATGEPLATGELLVMAGGSYAQRAIQWLEATHRARVVDASDAQHVRYRMADGGLLFSAASSTLSSDHDVFLVELTATPRGALVLNAAGYYSEGTTAAAWYVVHDLVPHIGDGTLTEGWLLVDWSRDGGSGQPAATDTWAPIASGR